MELDMARHSIWKDCSTELPQFHHRYNLSFFFFIFSLFLFQRKLQENVIVLVAGRGGLALQTAVRATGSTLNYIMMYVYQYICVCNAL